MDADLVSALIDRDWGPFLAQVRRLGLSEPIRSGERIDVPTVVPRTEERFVAVLLCDGYDALAPLLDFSTEIGGEVGRPHWPRFDAAPYNAITYNGRDVPILCTPGTRGYHLHPSHHTEVHDKSIWTLSCQATLIARLMTRMGNYQGRGL